MISKPKIEDHPEQLYVGIRAQMPPSKLRSMTPKMLTEVFDWLKKHGIKAAGAPFIRYHVINMEGNMDLEFGVPVAVPMKGDDRVRPGVIPAGRYASLVYSGVTGITGNKALIEWARKNGIQWDRWDDPAGDAFRSRVEFQLTDPAEEPDRKKWETEVAIRLADDSPLR